MWIRFNKERPVKDSKDKVYYLVRLFDCPDPMFGYFDSFSQRFSVFVPYIGKSVQVPVEWWMEVPSLPNE